MDSTRDNLPPDARAEYSLEVLCASWNPLAAAIAEPVEACREIVADLPSGDVEAFLASFYRSQQG